MDQRSEQPAVTSATISDVQDSIAAINKELVTVQSKLIRAESPWYRQPALIISLTALLFSFGTTSVSYYRTTQQDIHDARTELRTLILRLSQLPRENIEYSKKYADDSLALGSLSGVLNQENALVAKQAADIINRIPGHVGATEYMSVAGALSNSGLFDPALKLMTRAFAQSADANDEVAILRFFGQTLFATGKLEEGRQKYQAALQIFTKYPTDNQSYIHMTHLFTEMYWSQMETAARQCQFARSHLEEARAHLSSLPPGPGNIPFEGQINQTALAVASCVPSAQAKGGG